MRLDVLLTENSKLLNSIDETNINNTKYPEYSYKRNSKYHNPLRCYYDRISSKNVSDIDKSSDFVSKNPQKVHQKWLSSLRISETSNNNNYQQDYDDDGIWNRLYSEAETMRITMNKKGNL